MKEESMLLALWMRKQSIVPGNIIAIFSTNVLELYKPFFASLYIGAIVSLWHENFQISTLTF